MEVGCIGAGTVAGTFGRHLLGAGHTVVVSNARSAETLASFVADLGPGARAGTKGQAAEGEVVILAVNWVDVPAALVGINWRGRILIDVTNAHADPGPDLGAVGVARSRAALAGRTSSEIVARLAVGARLFKSISNLPMGWIQDFSPAMPRTVLFVSGDDAAARQMVVRLTENTGLAAVDLGSLKTGGAQHEVGAPLSAVEFRFVRALRRDGEGPVLNASGVVTRS